jgi:ATP-dependent DNA helicase RecQ
MTFGFLDLQLLIDEWNSVVPIPDHDFRDGICERICQILRDASQLGSMAALIADLQPLIRHCLLNENARTGQSVVLRVPCCSGWPSRFAWESHGVQAIQAGKDAFILSAQGWYPDWLSASDGGVFHDAFGHQQVRTTGECDADPFIFDATGFASYSSPGQREAVRAVFLMKPGETLLVNLPTGSGKSLVGQAPALVRKLDGALTIFVVPTVALAIDQERAMAAFIRRTTGVQKVWPLAWYGGLADEQRAEIRARLRDGTQRILFTSPEALITTLLGAVSEAARAGMLQYLVVDEAHLVTGWGDAFRPAFQALAGLRNNLLRASPRGFRTVLLSATYTRETVDTLATLFGPIEQVHMVSAVHLRPEPQYWFSRAESIEEKQERVLEALRHAPRPFILYVTKRVEIRKWETLLKQQVGMRRIACFDGGTQPAQRSAIIGDWVENRLDGIIATSAFGVGIDKSDVRTVIHATIPETVDRYYQEVGRGGRDGMPCISLLVYEDSDWLLPIRLARPMIVTAELGLSRWNAMYQTRRLTDDGNSFVLDIEARREKLRGTSEYNVDWNMRTLILMARAGLISLDVGVTEGTQYADDIEANEASSLLAALASIRVRIEDDGHKLAEVWEKRVSASRDTTINAAGRSLSLMRGLLKNGREVGKTLTELYQMDAGQWFVPVTRVCGGCPQDRFDCEAVRAYRMPAPTLLSSTETSGFDEWRRCFPWIDPTFVYVFYDDDRPESEIRQAIVKFVGWLVQECGVHEVGGDAQSTLWRTPDWLRLYRRASDGIVLHRSLTELDVEPYTPLARVTVLDSESSDMLLERVQLLERPYHIVVLPRSQPDPANHLRKLADVTLHAAYLHQLLPVISQ